MLSRVAWLAALALALAACGEPQGESLAQVNRETLTAQQLELLLKRSGSGADVGEAAQRQALERLIDQELAVQAVEAEQWDRDPAVRAQIDAARREVLARVFTERLNAGLSAPTPEQVARFYAEHPLRFAQRKLYRLQEVAIEADPPQVQALRARLAEAPDLNSALQALRAEGLRVNVNVVLRAPEQLPDALLGGLERMQDGHLVAQEVPQGLQLLQRLGVQPAPLSEEQARPAIQQLLVARARQERVQSELARLRKEARIEYRGRFGTPPGAASSAASS